MSRASVKRGYEFESWIGHTYSSLFLSSYLFTYAVCLRVSNPFPPAAIIRQMAVSYWCVLNQCLVGYPFPPATHIRSNTSIYILMLWNKFNFYFYIKTSIYRKIYIQKLLKKRHTTFVKIHNQRTDEYGYFVEIGRLSLMFIRKKVMWHSIKSVWTNLKIIQMCNLIRG